MLVKNNRADNDDKLQLNAKAFQEEICQRMKLVDLWKRHLHHKFGAVATQSEAVQRFIDHLTTKAGLLKVQECIVNSVPCHGNGGAESGIPECKALYNELDRCKAGGLPPPAVQPDLTGVTSALAANSAGVHSGAGGEDPMHGADRVVALAEESTRLSLKDCQNDMSDRPAVCRSESTSCI